MLPQLIKELQSLANPKQAKILQRFFKINKTSSWGEDKTTKEAD